MVYENVEDDIIKLFKNLERGTLDDDYNHKDVRIKFTNEWIDIKQPSKYNMTNGNIAWAITVVSDAGLPGAIFGEEKYIGFTNLYKQYNDTSIVCADNKSPWLFLIETEDIRKILKNLPFNFFKSISNDDISINSLNDTFKFSYDRGIFFQSYKRENTFKYFLVITEMFLKKYPKQFFVKPMNIM